MKDIKVRLWGFNFVCFIVGMVGVWEVTHSGWALFWTFIAAIHVEMNVKKKV